MSASRLQTSGPGVEALMKLVKELGGADVGIGVFAGEGGADGENVAIATIHEFGAPGASVPERSFLRSTADTKQREWISALEKLLGKVVDGKLEIGVALGLIGQRASSDVRKAITSGAGIPPPLKQATIDRKGSSRPLVDTGSLVNSISYRVGQK